MMQQQPLDPDLTQPPQPISLVGSDSYITQAINYIKDLYLTNYLVPPDYPFDTSSVKTLFSHALYTGIYNNDYDYEAAAAAINWHIYNYYQRLRLPAIARLRAIANDEATSNKDKIAALRELQEYEALEAFTAGEVDPASIIRAKILSLLLSSNKSDVKYVLTLLSKHANPIDDEAVDSFIDSISQILKEKS